MPEQLISLELDYMEDGGMDDLFVFPTLQLSDLPPSLRELKICSLESSFQLTGEWPAELRKIMLSKDISFERPIPAGVEKDVGRDIQQERSADLVNFISLLEGKE
jgi:hypothetical protein